MVPFKNIADKNNAVRLQGLHLLDAGFKPVRIKLTTPPQGAGY
jgi:hypothetical protein